MYLLAETTRTIIISGISFPVIRWAVFSILLIILLWITFIYRKEKVYFIFQLIVILCIGYYTTYLLQGIYSENVLHVSRWTSQGFTWPGSSYAVLSMVIGLPCSIYLFNSKNIPDRIPGILCGILSIATYFYYDSRMLFILNIGFMAGSFFYLDWKKAMKWCVIMFTVWLLMVGYASLMRMDIVLFKDYAEMTKDIGSTVIHPESSDYDRVIGIYAPMEAIKNNPLFGYGTYMHHTVLPNYYRQYADMLSHEMAANINNFIRTTAFAAYITDYGLVGLLLLLLNFLFTGIRLIIDRNKIFLLLGFSLCMILCWLFVGNILDNILLWIAIVPYGLIYKLDQSSQ